MTSEQEAEIRRITGACSIALYHIGEGLLAHGIQVLTDAHIRRLGPKAEVAANGTRGTK